MSRYAEVFILIIIIIMLFAGFNSISQKIQPTHNDTIELKQRIVGK